jgi:hypothetical protein
MLDIAAPALHIHHPAAVRRHTVQHGHTGAVASAGPGPAEFVQFIQAAHPIKGFGQLGDIAAGYMARNSALPPLRAEANIINSPSAVQPVPVW